jgi:hypothetical protein
MTKGDQLVAASLDCANMEKLEQEKKVKHQLFQSMVGCIPKCEGQVRIRHFWNGQLGRGCCCNGRKYQQSHFQEDRKEAV